MAKSRKAQRPQHLINPIANRGVDEVLTALTSAHEHIVTRAHASLARLDSVVATWGRRTKRHRVSIAHGNDDIGKDEEALVELINMAATVERLCDVLTWVRKRDPHATVVACHPTTSDAAEDAREPDLTVQTSEAIELIEITDVVSRTASSNNKEKKALKVLGCESAVPPDGRHRYIATSPEWADALCAPTRKWRDKHYTYNRVALPDTDTTVLEVRKRGES
jgi:hypothetical protein